MKSIGVLILGLMVGQACAATDMYHLTGVYGVPGNPIGAGKAPRDGTAPDRIAPPYDDGKRPLITIPGQMVRIGNCVSGSSHCEIVFTDIGGHTIRKLTTEKFIPEQNPNEQPHAIRTLIGVAGKPGDVDGTANPVIRPACEDDLEDGCERSPRISRSPSMEHCDKDGSGSDSDSDLGHDSHKSAFRKIVREHRGSDHGSVHEDSADRPVDARDFLKDDCELGSPHRSGSPSREHCDRDGSGSDSGSESESESCRLVMPLAKFNRPFGIASLPSDRGPQCDKGPQFLVSDIQNQSLNVVMPFGKANHLSQALSRGNPENPRFIASDGKSKYFCAADDRIIEIDFSYQPPRKTVIAGKMEVEVEVEVEDTFDLAAGLKCALSKDYVKELESLLRDDDCGSVYGSDTESDCGEKILVVPEALKGACGIAYTTTKDDNPTLYYTERDGNALGRLEYTSGNWTHHPVAPDAKFIKPTSISVTEDGSQVVVDKEGLKLIKLNPDDGKYKVTILVPAEQIPGAIAAEVGCNGDIYVGCGEDPNVGCGVHPSPKDQGHCIRRFSPPAPVPVPVPGGANAGTLATAAVAASSKSMAVSDGMDEQDFRFGLSSEQIMLTMRQRGVNFADSGGNDSHSRALNALEKAVDATHAIKQIGKGMTFWASGLYTQGSLSSMFGNPPQKLKHYGIMAGTHYKDDATQQIFGVAVNVGFGNSISKVDRDARTDNKAAQITLYYNKKFDQHWKFSLHNTLMRSMDRHQRPYIDDAGNRQIAIGNGVTYEFASMAEVSYKHEFCRDNYIKPFTGINYALNKEMAYKEKNAGNRNISYGNASMDQIGLQFGIKSSFGKKISDTKTFLMMPKISYTNFVKMGVTEQKAVNEINGATRIGKSGTPGRHLISASLAIGVIDYEANTTTKVAYTGNIQKQKKSHEVLLDWGMKF